jgi:hypothetical protein
MVVTMLLLCVVLLLVSAVERPAATDKPETD